MVMNVRQSSSFITDVIASEQSDSSKTNRLVTKEYNELVVLSIITLY